MVMESVTVRDIMYILHTLHARPALRRRGTHQRGVGAAILQRQQRQQGQRRCRAASGAGAERAADDGAEQLDDRRRELSRGSVATKQLKHLEKSEVSATHISRRRARRGANGKDGNRQKALQRRLHSAFVHSETLLDRDVQTSK